MNYENMKLFLEDHEFLNENRLRLLIELILFENREIRENLEKYIDEIE